VTPNIWGYLWGKEAYGAMLFATALTNESIADALAMPGYRHLYIALAREILAVAAARTVQPEAFDGFEPAAYLTTAPTGAAERSLDALVAHNRRSAKSHSGIWRDLAVRKRPTEVDAQLGIVVTLGAEAGVPTPLTARLVALVHEIERGLRPQSLDTLDALANTPTTNDERRTTNLFP
jgi:2-dehydropantoate 2-reductase